LFFNHCRFASSIIRHADGPASGGWVSIVTHEGRGQAKIDGESSVLFDAVAGLVSDEGAALLAGDATAKDFVSDAFGHCKFIGYRMYPRSGR
jgi:hypothetical protein